MKDRHALFIIGEYRTFDWCHLWYANKLPENIDVYVSTYDTSVEFRNSEVVMKNGKWDTQTISPILTPFNSPHNTQKTSLTYSITGISYQQLITTFAFNLKGHSIEERKIDEWYKDTTPTTKYIITHLKNCLEMARKHKTWEKTKNIYVLRMDSIPHTYINGTEEIFTFDEEIWPESFRLKKGTLYSPSSPDMEEWRFAGDQHFAAERDTMETWIDYLDADKHKEPHKGIAEATGELVAVLKTLQHENFKGKYTSTIIRRGMVPYMDWHFRRNLYPFSPKFDRLHDKCNKGHGGEGDIIYNYN
tara:strand:- start:591 stop:1499 length:909 start_codon:yes stop_codon:yes gene_type:complete